MGSRLFAKYAAVCVTTVFCSGLLSGCMRKDFRNDVIQDNVQSAGKEGGFEMTDTSGSSDIQDSDGVMAEGMPYTEHLMFVLAGGNGDTAVFSPESRNIAFAMFSELLSDSDRQELNDYIGGRDYLNYGDNDAFRIINRLWVNKDKLFDVSGTSLGDIAYGMDMSDSAAATKHKDEFVAKSTDNFIVSTPSVLGPDTLCDVMNIIYFKDRWADGDKLVDAYTSEFVDADGNIVNRHMMHDDGGVVRYSDCAHEYVMDYACGFKFHVILPDDGYDISDIELEPFVYGTVDVFEGDTYLTMPEFEAKSVYHFDFGDLGLPQYVFGPDVTGGVFQGAVPEISQVAKIRVDHEGTKAAAVTEVTMKMSLSEPVDVYTLVCNRPFVYYIEDTFNGDVAFVGCVTYLDDQD